MISNNFTELKEPRLLVPATYEFKLAHRFRIYVPSFNANGRPIPDKIRIKALRRCRSTIENLCGGTTEWQAVGSYIGNNGVVREPVVLISAYFHQDDNIAEELFAVCHWLRDYLRQECIAAEIDSMLYFIR